jgi:hypothetical protein
MKRDWQFHIGDRVYDVADQRHTGRLERIVWSTIGRVRWDDTGWLSDVPMTVLRRAYSETTDSAVVRRLIRDVN